MEYKNKMINSENTKFHPSMGEAQRRIDRQTDNPMDVSNAYDNDDYNDYVHSYYKEKTINGDKKKEALLKRLFKRIKKWFGYKN